MVSAPFVFKDYRGLVQLRLDSAEDLEHVHDLDPTRWSSTSVPVEQLLCDPAVTAYIDEDKNGRVRVREIQAAHRWLTARLKNRKRLSERSDTVQLADLDTSGPDGARLVALAEQRIKGQGSITLAQIREFRTSYAKLFPNGDGAVTPAQIDDPELRAFAGLVLGAQGGAPDLSGEPGVDEAQLDAFLERARAAIAWASEGAAPDAQTALNPLGPGTAEGSALVDALTPKLDQFFAQCDFLGHEKAGLERLTETAESLKGVDVRDTEALRAHLRTAPLGRLDPSASLDLESGLNPLFADDLRRLAREVLPLVLDISAAPPRLTRADWLRVRGAFDAHRAWVAKKPAELTGAPTGDALVALVDGPLVARLRALAAEDRRASEELQAISDLEKLALYQRWLPELVNNMVSFPALFSGRERCLFEVGTLVLDGREMNLCVRVADVAAHKAIADASNIFVLYVECERVKDGAPEKLTVCVGVTSGTRRGISEGKRGVFYDREGAEWDARVLDLIVKPISLFESAVAPFVRLRQAATSQVQKLMAARSAEAEARAAAEAEARAAAATSAALNPNLAPAGAPQPAPAAPAPAAAAPPAAPPPAEPAGGRLQGLLVGGGIAFAALGSALAFAVQTISNINPLNLLLGVLGGVGAILFISGFFGWLRLRKRDVSTLLEACGWAFNVRIYLRRALSLRFTRVPPLPSGAVRERSFVANVQAEEEPSSLRWLVPLLVLVAAAALGWQFRALWMPQLGL